MTMDRRDWMRLLAVLAAAQAPGEAQAPARISQDSLNHALRLMGLDFPAGQQAMMLPVVNRQLASFEDLRQTRIPLDTEPAFHFRPLMQPAGPAQPRAFRPAARPAPAWKTVEDLAFLSVSEIAPLVRARRVSSAELTKMYLARLKKYGPKLNCVITLTEELGLEQAGRADREIRAGKYRGPLHGIPWGAKDLFATKGIPTTWGAEPYAKQIIPYDATVVERLEKAGAVLVAKLSMGALAQGGLWFGGMTKTPWNTEESSSGSSAGSASATAAGLVGFSLGTETLGSIVSPSTRCGVTGLRPTYGRVSRYGAMGLSWTMDKIGPICRSSEDCALVFDAIRGPDGRDRTVLDAPFEWDARAPLAGMRIGWFKAAFETGEAEAKSVRDAALEKLRAAGAKLEPIELPALNATRLRIILMAEAAAAFDDLTRDRGVEKLKGQAASDWPNSFRAARLIPAVEYIRAQRARTLLMRQMEEFMAKWDVLVGHPGDGTLTPTNLTGHPQVVAPCGFVKGMPVTLLFTSGLCKEGPALRLAHALQQQTDWHRKQPKLEG